MPDTAEMKDLFLEGTKKDLIPMSVYNYVSAASRIVDCERLLDGSYVTVVVFDDSHLFHAMKLQEFFQSAPDTFGTFMVRIDDALSG